jgi:hypothetical protein
MTSLFHLHATGRAVLTGLLELQGSPVQLVIKDNDGVVLPVYIRELRNGCIHKIRIGSGATFTVDADPQTSWWPHGTVTLLVSLAWYGVPSSVKQFTNTVWPITVLAFDAALDRVLRFKNEVVTIRRLPEPVEDVRLFDLRDSFRARMDPFEWDMFRFVEYVLTRVPIPEHPEAISGKAGKV